MIKGIDISHLNSKVDIADFKAKGFGFVWIKATQGLTYQDAAFQGYWKECKVAGMIHGAYHFFDPRVDGVAQAKNLLSRGINFSLPMVLPPCVDVEDLVVFGVGGRIDDKATAAANKWVATNWKLCLQRLNDFLGYVKQQTGKDCIIYTYNNYPKEYYAGTKFANNMMWISSLQKTCPVRYDTGKQPEFWQFTYRLNNTDLDGDYYMGTQEQLNALANINLT